MKYLGGKFKLRNEILPIILKNRINDTQLYIEPFCGGCNTLAYVTGNRIANDLNFYLIEMWKALQNGWKPNEYYSKDEYLDVKNNKDKYDPHLVGWIGFNCSFKGKFFNGYSGKFVTKTGYERNYQKEAINAVLSQVHLMKNVQFTNLNYYDLEIPHNSIIYCDPPYENTTTYKVDAFNHSLFWDWVRNMNNMNEIYVSEYTAPDDFVCVWSKQISSRISGKNQFSTEKLFKYKG